MARMVAPDVHLLTQVPNGFSQLFSPDILSPFVAAVPGGLIITTPGG